MAEYEINKYCGICGELVKSTDTWITTIRDNVPQNVFHKKCYEKNMDDILKERNAYKKFYDEYREERDKDDWGI